MLRRVLARRMVWIGVLVFFGPLMLCAWVLHATAACPNQQAKTIDCPLTIYNCEQCPSGTNCADCKGTIIGKNKWDCEGAAKKSCPSAGENAQCKQDFKCKDKQGGNPRCEIDSSSAFQPENKALYKTMDCDPYA